MDGIHVDRVLQSSGEGRNDLVGVVTGPVEPAIHHALDAAAQRIEQGGGGQGGGSHRHRRLEGQRLRGQQHQPGVHSHQQPGHDRVGQGPGDDPVDVIQPVLEDADPDAEGERDGHDSTEGDRGLRDQRQVGVQ